MNKLGFYLAGAMALCGAATANAAVLDGWGFDTTNAGIASYTTDIGHLNLSGGGETVTVNLGANGTIDVGDTFTELGAIYSATYTGENCTGACDAGPSLSYAGALAFPNQLQVTFSGLAGTVTAYNPVTQQITFAFTPGVGNISIDASLDGGATFANHVADLGVVNPSGGSIGQFLGGLLPNGTTDLLLAFNTGTYPAGLIKDSSGTAMDPLVIRMAVHTQNTLASPAVLTTDQNGNVIATLNINSDGSVNTIPEPAPLAVIAVGLIALAWSRRRKA